MYLVELFDNPYEWKWDDDRGLLTKMLSSKLMKRKPIVIDDEDYKPSKLRAKFKSLAATFQVEDKDGTEDTIWVMFHNNAGNQWEVTFDSQRNKIDKDKRYELTNTGHPSKVVATVIDIIKSFVANYTPAVLSFSATDKKRKAIYRTIAGKFKSYKGYKSNISDSPDFGTTFTFYNY